MEFDVNFLYISKDTKDKIITEIDETQYMDLQYTGTGNSGTSRLDLYLYAMSLGRTNPTELQGKDTFVRNDNLTKNVEAIAMIIALSLGKKKEFENLEDILVDKDMALYSDKCANTGFKIIQNDMGTRSGENDYLQIIDELDDLYESNVGPLD